MAKIINGDSLILENSKAKRTTDHSISNNEKAHSNTSSINLINQINQLLIMVCYKTPPRAIAEPQKKARDSMSSLESLCEQSFLVLCPLFAKKEPSCYSRNVDINSFLLFEPSVLLVHLLSIAMTVIMIWSIRSKYTAIGRKEICWLFYLYLLVTCNPLLTKGTLSLILVVEFFTLSGLVPYASLAYPYFAGLHTGLVSALFWALFFNAFGMVLLIKVPFQVVEDGTRMSIWTLRITSACMMLFSFIISSALRASVLVWILYCLVNAGFILFYYCSQVFLILKKTEDKWLLVDISFALFFFVLAQISVFFVSNTVCTVFSHYMDGLFLSTGFNLLSMMMIYKYWASLTKEDIEFSVGIKPHSWEIRDPLLGDNALRQMLTIKNQSQAISPHSKSKFTIVVNSRRGYHSEVGISYNPINPNAASGKRMFT